MIKYKGYILVQNPKPIPIRSMDWDFYHEDYDGAIDSCDYRCGTGSNLDDCKQLIDEMEDEMEDEQTLFNKRQDKCGANK